MKVINSTSHAAPLLPSEREPDVPTREWFEQEAKRRGLMVAEIMDEWFGDADYTDARAFDF